MRNECRKLQAEQQRAIETEDYEIAHELKLRIESLRNACAQMEASAQSQPPDEPVAAVPARVAVRCSRLVLYLIGHGEAAQLSAPLRTYREELMLDIAHAMEESLAVQPHTQAALLHCYAALSCFDVTSASACVRLVGPIVSFMHCLISSLLSVFTKHSLRKLLLVDFPYSRRATHKSHLIIDMDKTYCKS